MDNSGRANEPICWSETSGLSTLSNCEEIVDIFKDSEFYSSGEGIRPGLPVCQALIDKDDPKRFSILPTMNA